MIPKIAFLLPVSVIAFSANAAVVARQQSAIQTGTTVRARVNTTGVYDQECYDAYYGCMDQFCIIDNTNGGSCACSDQNEKLEQELAKIQETLNNAERIRAEEVERVKAGANADIIFNGTRRYDEKGNVIYSDVNSTEKTKDQQRANLLSLWDNMAFDFDEDVFESSVEDIANKTGDALFVAADDLCREQMPASCAKDLNFLHQLYARQIISDCKAFENSIAKSRANADAELANANASLRAALKESFADANKYTLGECMIEFRKCMQTDDACGDGWTNCVSTAALDNIQNGVKSVTETNSYGISGPTMEILDSKRVICERVLNQCVAVRDQVWPAFLREVAPSLKVAELNAESNFRQSCLASISDCIRNACSDDIANKGVATMDACLARPDMARSFCKIEIERCERVDSFVWQDTKDKLAAMRVDACTAEVKDCITDETRCGADFSNCIGMDYEYIHNICPIDKLVVCKANNPNFSMSDLDSMLMGLYWNIDNAALHQCQNLVEAKMMEICGSTTDCNKFAADDTIGTGSLRSVKDGDKYRITGMISFGSIKMGDASGNIMDGDLSLSAGQIGIQDYLTKVRQNNKSVSNQDSIISAIEEELNNIAGTINRTIDIIEQDPEIQFCISGRSLDQITGRAGKTVARYPHLLDEVKTNIARAALRKAQDNYSTKYDSLVADATRNASVDVAQYMCQMKPVANGAPVDATVVSDTALAPSYAISYEVGVGLDINTLARGGRGTSTTGSTNVAKIGHIFKVEMPSGTREMWSSFNRDTRVCHFCTSTVTKDCKNKGSRGLWGLWDSRGVDCTESEPIEKCEDIEM